MLIHHYHLDSVDADGDDEDDDNDVDQYTSSCST